jgi:hypothetical protein
MHTQDKNKITIKNKKPIKQKKKNKTKESIKKPKYKRAK